MEAVRIEGLSKNFGALEVLKDLSLSVESGEYVAIIGPNGAGKTTLLNVITGELEASAGRVYIFGQDITATPVHRHASIGLARSFQISRLFHNLTVLDNITLALHGIKPSRYHMFLPVSAYCDCLDKAQELLKSIDLWEKRDEPAKTISYGEQRKMEFMLSLCSEPKVLLLDEPTAGLSIAEVPEFVDTIKNLARGTTLIFVAHDMDVVFSLAHRIVVLYLGKFIADGTSQEIKANPLVKEIYLGLDEGRADA
ncbi:MAG: ABC transporter ATP-binding protein [Chloroflexota bacterium]